MTEYQDNAGEVVAAAVRVALTAAGQLAERAARRREAELREAERDSAARVATLQSQLTAERELALRSVRDVVQRGDAANADELVRAWEQARSWDDPTMGVERAQLEERIRERFGEDPPSPSTDRMTGQRSTAATLTAQDLETQAGDERHRNAAQHRVDGLQSQLVAAGVDDDVAAARALAAESYPMPVSQAASKPRAVSIPAPQRGRRGKAMEVQAPGR